jgi:hypothetical protein
MQGSIPRSDFKIMFRLKPDSNVAEPLQDAHIFALYAPLFVGLRLALGAEQGSPCSCG